MDNKNIQKQIVNRAMKDFRKTQSFAKENGEQINSIFYLGERLTPLQVDFCKEFIYSLSKLNDDIGKDKADMLMIDLMTDIMVDLFIKNTGLK